MRNVLLKSFWSSGYLEVRKEAGALSEASVAG
jgi:hypothetical protein